VCEQRKHNDNIKLENIPLKKTQLIVRKEIMIIYLAKSSRRALPLHFLCTSGIQQAISTIL